MKSFRPFPPDKIAFWALSVAQGNPRDASFTLTSKFPAVVIDYERREILRLRGKMPECANEIEILEVNPPTLVRPENRFSSVVFRTIAMPDGTCQYLIDHFASDYAYYVVDNEAECKRLHEKDPLATVFRIVRSNNKIERVCVGEQECMLLNYTFVKTHKLKRETHDFWTRVAELETKEMPEKAVQAIIHKLAIEEEKTARYSIAPYGRIEIELLCSNDVDTTERAVLPHRAEEYVAILGKRQRETEKEYRVETGALRVVGTPVKRCKT